MTNTNKPTGTQTENTSNATTVHNPKAPGEVEKVDPTTGGTHSTESSGIKPEKR